MKKYFVKLPAGSFIAIEHGDTRYKETTIENQEHADALNEAQGIKPVEPESALICSMTDNWQNFNSVVRMLRGSRRP